MITNLLSGALQSLKNSKKYKLTMEVCVWVQVSLGLLFLLENHPKIAYISTDSLGYYTMRILCVNTLLKVVGIYDLGVLSMSVMGFQKIKFG